MVQSQLVKDNGVWYAIIILTSVLHFVIHIITYFICVQTNKLGKEATFGDTNYSLIGNPIKNCKFQVET